MPNPIITVVALAEPEAAAPFAALFALTREVSWRGSEARRQPLLELVRSVRPDVLLVLLSTGGISELKTLIEQVAESSPQTRPIAVAYLNGALDVEAWLDAGACGVLSSSAAPYEIVHAITQVGDGRVVLCAGARLLLEVEEAHRSDLLVQQRNGFRGTTR